MRFILHGGFKNLKPAEAQTAWIALLNRAIEPFASANGAELCVFILPWALPKKRWPSAQASFNKRLGKYLTAVFGGQKTYSSICLETPEDLDRQLKDLPHNKVCLVYIPGGILPQQAIEKMQRFGAVMGGLRNQQITFIGVSAGAYALAETYFNPRKKMLQPGGGLVHAGVCCHGDEKRRAALRQNAATPDGFHVLADGEFILLDSL